MAHIELEKLDETQDNALRIMRKFGEAKIYLHNDQQEGLVSAKAIEVLEAMGYVEVLPPDKTDGDNRKLMRAKIKAGVEDMGDKFKVTFNEPWQTLDATRGIKSKLSITIPAGTYTMVRVPNPQNDTPAPWLVIEGTMIGQAEGSLRQWEDGYGGLEIEPDHTEGLITAAKMYSLRLSDYDDGEDVTGMKNKLAQLQSGPVSLDDAMAVIVALAEAENMEALKPWQQELVIALRRAKRIAHLYSLTDDGGTCNMDTAVLIPNRGWRENLIEQAAWLAGVTVSVRPWMRQRCVFVRISEGQGFRRTMMAEAAAKVLKDCGYETSIYYQMD